MLRHARASLAARWMGRWAATIVAMCAAGATGTALAAPPLYRIVEVGVVQGFEQVWAVDINDNGEVLGQMEMAPPDLRICPFIWRPDTGLHPCRKVYPAASMNVRALNRNGLAAAQRYDRAGDPYPFTWSPAGGFKRLERPGPGTTASVSGVNEAGDVVGSTNPGGGLRAAMWRRSGELIDRHPTGYDGSIGYGINKHGDISGQIMRGIKMEAGLIARDGTVTVFPCLDNVVADDCNGRAWALNNLTQVVGEHQYPGDWRNHAYLWSASTGMRQLTAGGPYAAFSSSASDINDRGEVVGTMSGRIDGVDRSGPFRWSEEDGVHALADLIAPTDPLAGRVSFLRNSATAINRWGAILANAYVDGVFDARALVLVPQR